MPLRRPERPERPERPTPRERGQRWEALGLSGAKSLVLGWMPDR